MKIGHLVGITLNEFLVWYSSGEFRCGLSRLLPVPLDSSRKPIVDDARRLELMEGIPNVDLEEEHSVLLALLDLGAFTDCNILHNPSVSVRFQTAYLPISSLQVLYPLTARSSRLLASRLEGCKVRLEQPIFESTFVDLWAEWTRRRAVNGAKGLLKLAMQSTFVPTPTLEREGYEALRLAGIASQCPLPDKGLLANVFCYDRHKPITDADLGYIIDLGVVLKERYANDSRVNPLIDSLREFCKQKEYEHKRLFEILAEPDFSRMLADGQKQTDCPVHIAGLILFLQWKYQAQRTGGVEIDKLLIAVKQGLGTLPADILQESLWLFGLFCGFERIAQDVYASDPGQYTFYKGPASLQSKRLKPDDIPLASPPTAQPASDEKPAHPSAENQVQAEQLPVITDDKKQPKKPRKKPGNSVDGTANKKKRTRKSAEPPPSPERLELPLGDKQSE